MKFRDRLARAWKDIRDSEDESSPRTLPGKILISSIWFLGSIAFLEIGNLVLLVASKLVGSAPDYWLLHVLLIGFHVMGHGAVLGGLAMFIGGLVGFGLLRPGKGSTIAMLLLFLVYYIYAPNFLLPPSAHLRHGFTIKIVISLFLLLVVCFIAIYLLGNWWLKGPDSLPFNRVFREIGKFPHLITGLIAPLRKSKLIKPILSIRFFLIIVTIIYFIVRGFMVRDPSGLAADARIVLLILFLYWNIKMGRFLYHSSHKSSHPEFFGASWAFIYFGNIIFLSIFWSLSEPSPSGHMSPEFSIVFLQILKISSVLLIGVYGTLYIMPVHWLDKSRYGSKRTWLLLGSGIALPILLLWFYGHALARSELMDYILITLSIGGVTTIIFISIIKFRCMSLRLEVGRRYRPISRRDPASSGSFRALKWLFQGIENIHVRPFRTLTGAFRSPKMMGGLQKTEELGLRLLDLISSERAGPGFFPLVEGPIAIFRTERRMIEGIWTDSRVAPILEMCPNLTRFFRFFHIQVKGSFWEDSDEKDVLEFISMAEASSNSALSYCVAYARGRFAGFLINNGKLEEAEEMLRHIENKSIRDDWNLRLGLIKLKEMSSLGKYNDALEICNNALDTHKAIMLEAIHEGTIGYLPHLSEPADQTKQTTLSRHDIYDLLDNTGPPTELRDQLVLEEAVLLYCAARLDRILANRAEADGGHAESYFDMRDSILKDLRKLELVESKGHYSQLAVGRLITNERIMFILDYAMMIEELPPNKKRDMAVELLALLVTNWPILEHATLTDYTELVFTSLVSRLRTEPNESQEHLDFDAIQDVIHAWLDSGAMLGKAPESTEAEKALFKMQDLLNKIKPKSAADWLRWDLTFLTEIFNTVRPLEYMTLALLLASTGAKEEAHNVLDSYDQRPSTIDDVGIKRFETLLRGKIYEELNEDDKAYVYYKQAARQAVLLRQSVKTEEWKISLFSLDEIIFHKAILLSQFFGDKNGLFEFIESSKSVALVDLMTSQRINFSRVPSSLINTHKQVARRMWYLRSEIYSLESMVEIDPSTRAVIQVRQAELGDLAENERKLWEEIKRRDPEQSGVTTAEIPDVKEAIESFNNNSRIGFVEYYVYRDTLICFAIIGGEVYTMKLLPSNNSIINTVDELKAAVSYCISECSKSLNLKSELREFTRICSVPLYECLFRPLERFLVELDHVVIAPHGFLHLLPFEVAYDSQIGQFAIDRWSISYTQSYAMLKLARGKALSSHIVKPSVVILANPLTGTDLPTLPYAEVEAARVSEKFPRAVLLIGSKATKSQLKAKGRNCTVVHFACHSEFFHEAPMLSVLMLAQEGADEGRLYAYELFELDWPETKIVTLSSCESGNVGISSGDELMGLVRGAFYAGASAIVRSHWVVHDRSAAELMELFYDNLRSMPIAKALTEARKYQKNSNTSFVHPHYWAAFSVIGDPELSIAET